MKKFMKTFMNYSGKSFLLCALILLIIAVFPQNTQAAYVTGKYEVTASSLNVRATNGTSGAKLGTVSKGTILQVTAISSNNWGKITYNNKQGWVSLQYCKLKAADSTQTESSSQTAGSTQTTEKNSETGTGDCYEITATKLNVRSGPGTSYSSLGTLAKGEQVNVSAVSGKWGKITYKGKTGWISLDYCKKITVQAETGTGMQTTESTTQSTESGTQTTESATQSTESTTQTTESTTQSTESATQSTESATQSTESATQSTEEVTQKEETLSTGISYTVTATSLNVRSGAGTSYSKLGSLTKGKVISVLSISSNNWGSINYNGKTGWVSLQYCVKDSNAEISATELNQLSEKDGASQFIIVAANGSTAEVAYYVKADNSWTRKFSVSGYVGRNGIGKTKEGDGKTPTGTYHFTKAFGIAADPGCSLGYTQVTDSDYWVDDSASAYYNQFVSTDEVTKDWSSAEHLIDSPTAYQYVLALDYNSSCTSGAGSAIFLHCSTEKATSGCIAIPASYMKVIMMNVTADCEIIIR